MKPSTVVSNSSNLPSSESLILPLTPSTVTPFNATTIAIPPSINLSHPPMSLYISFVVPLVIADLYPELLVSPSLISRWFRIYVSRRLSITCSIRWSVTSQFPRSRSSRSHPETQPGPEVGRCRVPQESPHRRRTD